MFERQSEVWFLRFDNILTERDGAKLKVTTLPDGEVGLEVPCPNCGKTEITPPATLSQPIDQRTRREGTISVAQEPTVVSLSDGRLITVMRTRTGYVHYALSRDGGRPWDSPRPLRFAPGGDRIPQPLAPSPLYKLHDGRLVLIFHNNRGDANGGKGPTDSKRVRRPVFIAVGRETDDPDQPVIFTQPRLLADNGGTPSPAGHTQIGTYPSLFEHRGKAYFWYPDRKHDLYGMVLGEDLLKAPE